MLVCATVASVLAVIIWIVLLFARGQFWNVQRVIVSGQTPSMAPRIAAIIPARDESDVIGEAVTSVLSQGIHVFLVDDDSSDGTADVARRAAEAASRSSDLTIIESAPLPPGWAGKLWAVYQGVRHASQFAPEFLLMSDADITHDRRSIASLTDIAIRGDYDLVSFMVKLHCRSLAEKLLIPAFVFFFFELYPPSWISNPKYSTAGAAGGCILIRPEALASAGGIEAIRNEIIDDCALARAVKRSGGKVWLGLTNDAHSIRPYTSFSQIGRMISRTAFNQLHHSTLLLAGALAGLTITYLMPILLLFSGNVLLLGLGAAVYAAMTFSYFPMIRFYRLNPAWALTLPLAAIFYGGATAHSALAYWLGRGGKWKGRVQDIAVVQKPDPLDSAQQESRDIQ